MYGMSKEVSLPKIRSIRTAVLTQYRLATDVTAKAVRCSLEPQGPSESIYSVFKVQFAALAQSVLFRFLGNTNTA